MAQAKDMRKDRFTWSGGQVQWDKPAKKKTTKTTTKKGKK